MRVALCILLVGCGGAELPEPEPCIRQKPNAAQVSQGSASDGSVRDCAPEPHVILLSKPADPCDGGTGHLAPFVTAGGVRMIWVCDPPLTSAK